MTDEEGGRLLCCVVFFFKDTATTEIYTLSLHDALPICKNVFLNPDLGNVLWNYDIPEENIEDCIVALAPYSKYWHCKNLQRIHVPELGHSYFVRCPLPDGDIDYRYAIGAMIDADFNGYVAIEGATDGDFITKDLKSLVYMKEIFNDFK